MSAAARLHEFGFETLELELDSAILTVTVNRPAVLNALSAEVIAELRSVVSVLRESLGVRDARQDPDWSVRGLMLTGAGAKSFVAGADIAAMSKMSQAALREYTREAQELTSWLETLPIPVAAAVNGFALGGGCELAMSCDYIYASENASFGQPEVALGLIPGFGGTVRLSQYVGVAAARELILTGRRIDATEALHLGLVSRILPDVGALHEAAKESLLLAASQSPVAVAEAKRTIRAVQHLSTDSGLTVELDAFVSRAATPDMIEGTSAFLEKRKPEFPGL